MESFEIPELSAETGKYAALLSSMEKKMKRDHPYLCRLLILTLLSSTLLCGCSGLNGKAGPIVAGETVSPDSKWINSEIDGAIDSSTKTNLKDDFYTAVNRDWLLQTTVTAEKSDINPFTENEDILRDREMDIVAGTDSSSTGENPAGMSQELLWHDSTLLQDFTDLAGDWEARNKLGAEPVRPYIEKIADISSIEDMTEYLLNEDGMNFSLDYPVDFNVTTGFKDHSCNTVLIAPFSDFTLGNQSEYTGFDSNGSLYKYNSNLKVGYLLKRLGYSDADAAGIIKGSYSFEADLADRMEDYSVQHSVKYLDRADNAYTFDELKTIEGNYPLTEILCRYQLDKSDHYTVTEPAYVKAFGKYYSQAHLERIKDFYIVSTLNSMLPLLDREAYEKSVELEQLLTDKAKDDPGKNPGSDPQQKDSGEDKETAILLDKFVNRYLPGPLDEIYVARYCTADQKKNIEKLVADVIRYYRVMLQSEDWLSDSAKKKAVVKLDNICVRSVYPDTFTDYSSLDLSGAGNLVEAVARIQTFALTQMKDRVNAPVERNAWDLSKFPTTQTNAYYNPEDNSINILAGIFADDFFYSPDQDREETLGRIGFIIGHEITHAFDTTGCYFDESGNYLEAGWWEAKDLQAFLTKAARLANFYSAIAPYPGAYSYDGTNVKGEAIADMGGLKCMISLAQDQPDFDYDEFFRAYAQMWQRKSSYEVEQQNAADEHPLNFLRTNITLQQYDRFFETYGIASGDGMYIEPEKRVAVW
ncbi:MAG: M13 family metallopeptidase [Lachnospiraceae bacterium]|jgi:putative endopeptidase|nr:M13 family metallopeptidase [Lachnospiraceae bacterium]